MAREKKKISIRLKLIGIIVPIVLVLIVAFFVLATNMVSKLSKEELLSKSQVYAEDISSWTRQIFSELQVYLDTIEEGNFDNDEEILKYLETTLDKNEAYPIGLYMGMTVVYILMVQDGCQMETGCLQRENGMLKVRRTKNLLLALPTMIQ